MVINFSLCAAGNKTGDADMNKHEPWRPNEAVIHPREFLHLVMHLGDARTNKAAMVCMSIDAWMLANMENYRESQNRDT